MSPNDEKYLEYLKRTTADLRQAKRRLRELEEREREPIAIVGMSCRLPGSVRDAEGLWKLVAEGTDAISGFPPDRGWDAGADDFEASYACRGGFVYDVSEFDAGFFGISPREALAMDPQQRLLLEVSWEALEQAGIDPRSLRGNRTGVFVGSWSSGYNTSADSGYMLTAGAMSVMSGRVAYTMGLEGPAVTVDTACSSSLVALHLAGQALRGGECDLAMAGGVTVMANPDVFAGFGQQQGLAADGRCKSFSAAADGTGWGEGAGVLVLEKLSDARRNGHRVLAVVAGSAVNQDGASNGLTAPNGPAQQRVIRAALASARISADQVDVVEGHGTGTTLGDPMEAQALLATYGQGRDAERPLWLGSVKSNIGHTQAAAGVAGVIKMVQALRHETLPRTLHADEPSVHVDWSSGAMKLLTEAVPWPAGDRPRWAGVSSFGISGTNVHVIVGEAPRDADVSASPGEHASAPGEPVRYDPPALPALAPGVTTWLVSGRTPEALRAQAGRLAEFVAARPELDPADVGWSLAATRSSFTERAVVTGSGRDELLAGVAAIAAGEPSAVAVLGMAAPVAGVAGATGAPGKTVLVFPGQGSQWAGMGGELAAVSPVFAARLAECAAVLEPYTGWSLVEVLGGPAEGFAAADVVQPALWAVMVSLAAVWEAAGVVPDAVAGHSQGEIAAATVAGVLSLADGARVVALRSRALRALAGRGGMLSVAEPAAALRERIAALGGRAGRVEVAAVNGPAATVAAGDPEALAALAAACASAGVRTRAVAVDYASHTVQVEEIREEILAALDGIVPGQARVPMMSAMTGEWLAGPEAGPGYWYESLRAPVEFDRAVRVLAGGGHRVFIEASPHPVLVPAVTETLEDIPGLGGPVTVAGTLRRGDGGSVRLLASLAEVFTLGTPVDWPAVLPPGRAVDLPTYAFQRQRYWPSPARVTSANVTAPGGDGAAGAAAGWRYRVGWVPVPDPGAARLTGTWLVMVPGGQADTAARCGRALEARGARVLAVEVAVGVAADRGLLGAVIGGVAADAEVAGVVSLLALDEVPLVPYPVVAGGLAGTLALVQALGDASVAAPLWVLTRGAVGAVPGEVVSSLVQAQAWGLGRVAGLEHPGRWGGLVDLPAEWDERVAGWLCGVLAGGTGEDQIAIRGSGVLARRLVRAPAPRRPGSGRWSARETALVTGGTGVIGPHVAAWLAGGGARHVVLPSRLGGQAPNAARLAAGLAAAGARTSVIACDVADRAHVAGLLDWIQAEGPPLRTVVHAAVAVDLVALGETETAGLATGLNAKVAGAALLDELTAGLDLDAFVLFSSIAGVWGSGFHGAYAAANAYLDVLATDRRVRGLPATSVAWGVWEEGRDDLGPVPESVSPASLRRQGMTFLDPARALRVLGEVLAAGETFIAAADVDWERFAPVFRAARAWRLFDEIPEVRALAAPAAEEREHGQRGTGLAGRLAGLAEAERERETTELVRGHAAAVLGHNSASEVAPGRAFRDMGFDSLTAVELRDRLNAAAGLRLPSTVVFDYPSPVALARYVLGELLGAARARSALPVPVVRAEPGDPVVIVGMGCRFPGGVGSPEDLWELVAGGGDAIAGFPADRDWDMAALYDPDPDQAGKSYVRAGGFLADAAGFDPGFFGISPREALAMDPQQRLLLEVSWEAIERAGIDPASLRAAPVGVFAGASPSGYEAGPEASEGHLLTGGASSVLSGRVSYALGLEGPAVTLDTACSSSLVALHLAAQALRAGDCRLALAGGVAVMATPVSFQGFSRQRALAADGRCKAFGAAADGMGLAEGVGMIVLERLSDARRNGHRVLAVVRGSAVNSDGASNGLTAPNGPSQQRVIRAALANAGLTAADVDAVEAHGTGTTLGDPIEAHALLATYGRGRPEGRPLLLGSVKSNIGHTQTAAGAAGVIKMVLALRHGLLPATLHAAEPSTHVDWASGQVRLLDEPVPWPRAERPRRAGVSAFGISGTNAHVILEEAPIEEASAGDSAEAEPGASPVVTWGAAAWLVSGRTAAGLAAQAERLAGFLAARPDADAADVGWSLVATRTAFEHRAVVTGTSRSELAAGLAALAAGRPAAGLVRGAVAAGIAAGKTVLVFPGQGSQWAGMGRELAACSPVFAARLAECAAALAPHTGWSLMEVLAGPAAGLESADVVQPALWAVMVSLAAVWEAAGVLPDAVVGHSQGEIAAACVAGILSLQDAAKVVALRSRALTALAGQGGMLSVAEPAAAVRERIAGMSPETGAGAGRVEVAAVNGPAAVVVSGDPAALDELAAACSAGNVRVKPLAVDYASHSAQVERIRDEILTALDGITPGPAQIPMMSAMTGEWLAGPEAGPGYWYDSLRAPVEFDRAVRALAGSGHRVFIEASPHPVLAPAITETTDDIPPASLDGPATVTGTLRRDDGGPGRLLASLAEVFVHDTPVSWQKVLPAGRILDLPAYAFQHQRYWPRPAELPPTGWAGWDAAGSPAEARFWAEVEGGDLQALSRTLAIADSRPLDRVLPALASWRRRERDRSLTESWRYRIAWVPVADPGPSRLPETLSGTWLVVVPAGQDQAAHLAADCARALRAHGAETVIAEVDGGAAGGGETAREALAARLGDTVAGADPALAGVLSLLALAETPLPEHPVVPAGLAGTLALVQAMDDAGTAVPLWAVTRGAVAAGVGERLTDPVQAQAWGLGRVAGLEYPRLWGGLVDLPPAVDERTAARLCAVLAGCGEDQVAIRGAGILARRLERTPLPDGDGQWTTRGTALLTGGTGGAGRHVARWLARGGARRVVLTSRSGPAADGTAGLAAELAGHGARAEVIACDVARRDEAAGVLARIGADGPPLTAVLHAAGIGQFTALKDTTVTQLADVLSAKAGGAAHLDELTKELPLDAFVLFSSGSATWGSGRQSAYAAANAYLDALARRRHDRGQPATSVAWGLWGGGGMGDGEASTILLRHGLRVMDPELAVRALDQAMAADEAEVTVADVDWARFAATYTMARPSPLISGLPEAARSLASGAAAHEDETGRAAAGRRLADVPPADRGTVLLDLIRAEATAVLQLPATETVEARRPFRELGFDSLTAVELRNRLVAATGLKLPATLAFDYPTSAVLADHLITEIYPDQAATRAPGFAELDQLESVLSAIPADNDMRAEITVRLQTVLSKWLSFGDAPKENSVAGRLADASAAEVLDFLSKELGVEGI